MGVILIAEKLFDGERILADVAITIGDSGLISAVGGGVSSDAERLPGLLVPGFIDIQVNGGGGVLFNQEPSVNALQKISEAHSQFGTSAFLPTLITDSFAVMQRAADAVSGALSSGVPGVIGVHFEGPHLSEVKKGTHEGGFIRSLSHEELLPLRPGRPGNPLGHSGARVCIGIRYPKVGFPGGSCLSRPFECEC
ncbi:hypothetical protein [Microbulbifer sp. SSSA005]|uniref:hypothetical protein n=1 Tax=unclassified Microbulbifer TaxID=2619833 RepID=UPI0040395CED